MADNLFIRLIAILNRALSRTQIQKDISQLEKTPFYLRLIAKLNKSASASKIRQDLNQVTNNQRINVNARVNRHSLLDSLREAQRAAQNSVHNNPINIPVNAEGLNSIHNAQEDIINNSGGIRGVVQNYVNWNRVLELIIQSMKKAVDKSVELAKAQTDLQIVTGKNNEQIERLMRNYNQLAQDLSATTVDVTKAADEWLRTGKSISDTTELIADSTILSKIGQIDAADATKYLTSAMNGFNVETKDVIGIVDKLSAVDMVAAVSSGGLAEAMSKCASSAQIAGVSIDTLNGYIAAVKETTQKSDSVIDESFKTIFARMGKIKLGNYIDDDGTDISGEINDVEKVLSKFDIKLRNSADEFRNFEDVIYDVGMAWNKFTSVDQNAIANAFGGVYQRENVLTLFNNFNRAMELTEISANSAGTALKKYEIYENSLEAATNRLTAAFESLAYNTVSQDFLKSLADGAAGIVEFVDKTKLIQTTLTALSFTGIIKGLLLLGTKLMTVKTNINAMTTAMNLATQTTQRNAAQNTLLAQSFNRLTPAQQRLILSSKKLSNEQRIELLTLTGLTEEQARAQLQTMGLVTAENTATASTFSLRGAWEALKVSIASNPIGLIVTALTSATMIISTCIEKQKEYNQQIEEAAEQAKQEMTEITDLYSQYRELSKAVETDSSKKSDLIKVTDTLLEKLGYEKTKIQELADEYGSLDDAIKNITIQGLQEKEDALISDYALKKNNLITDRNWFTDWFFSDKAKSMTIPLSIDYLVEDDPNLDKVFDVIKNSGIFREVSESTLTLNNSNETVEGVLKNYDDISKAIDILKEKFSSTDLSDNKIFTALVTQQTALKTNIDSYNGAISNLNSNVAQQQVLTALLGKELPSTPEEFDSFIDSLLASAEASDEWKDRFVGGTDAAKEAIITVLRQMPEFADFFQNEIPNSTDTANTSVATLTETLAALKKALEDIIGFSDTYKSAMSKIAAGTALTADEVMKLLEIDPTLFDKFTKSKDGWKIDLGELQASYSLKVDSAKDNIVGSNKEDLQKQLETEQANLDRLIAEKAGLVTNDSVTRAMAANLDKQISETKSKIEQAKQDLGLSDMFAEMLDFTSIDLLDSSSEIVLDKIDDYNDGISSLNKAVDTMNEGNTLSYDEMTTLVQLYPQLKNNIVETANGYTIEKSALEDVRQQTYKTRDTYIDSQIDMAISAIEQSKIRISQYETEISCINSIGNYQAAVASGLFENLNKEREKIKAAEDLIALLESLKNNVVDPGDSGKSNKKEIDILQQQIDYYKMLLEAIEIVTDKVIEGIEKEKEAIDSKIDKLNDEKDALQDKNDEQQRELDLIEAKNNLDKAKKQKVFVYKEGQGLVQVQDEKAVADAQKEYDNVQNEIKKANIDKQINALEKQNEELDKQIDGWNEYKDQFSNMENDVKDTLTVEQAKKALGTDEKGLLSLDEKTINGIRDGLAEAVYKKDVEDNKDNNKYVEVSMDKFLKSLGATVSWAEFKEIANNIMGTVPAVTPLSNIGGSSNTTNVSNSSIVNNKPVNINSNITINEASDPVETANVVQNYMKNLLTQTINSTK